MRYIVTVFVAVGTLGLSGCGSTPADPLASVRMLTPAELEDVKQERDSIEQSEKAQNALFSRPVRRSR